MQRAGLAVRSAPTVLALPDCLTVLALRFARLTTLQGFDYSQGWSADEGRIATRASALAVRTRSGTGNACVILKAAEPGSILRQRSSGREIG